MLLGRQTIHIHPSGLNAIFAEVGVTPQPVPDDIDVMTREARVHEEGTPRMSDTAFFAAFGVKRLRAIDHDNFEGADIILDLTRRIPAEAEGIADFIFDGSVMDNVFNPAEAIGNVTRMLRPGGRYFGINMAGTRNAVSYVAFNPYWYFDYFVLNGFRDVKVYIYDYYDFPPKKKYLDSMIHAIDPHARHEDIHSYQPSAGLAGLLIIAEKGTDSTADRSPAQGVYRSEAEWEVFREKLAPIKRSPRPFVTLRKQAHCLPFDNPKFTYLGNVDSQGLCSANLELVSEQLEDGSVAFGGAFAGYGWMLPEFWEGKSWRRVVGGLPPSVVMINTLSYRDYRVEFDVHTAVSLREMEELSVVCKGEPLATRVRVEGSRLSIAAALPRAIVGSGLLELELSMPPGKSIGLSGLRFTLVRRREPEPDLAAADT
jgi:hypothetical protein